MRRPSLVLLASGCAGALLLTACGSASTAAPATSSSGAVSPGAPTSPAPAQHSGDVDVLSAGSLQDLMQSSLAPAFHAATGYTEVNFSAGSSDLAKDIQGKVKQGDVFISASPQVNTTLEGAANGDWVSWYATFARSKLVLGYDPKSTFAAELRSMPWYDVVGKSGFRLGLTPPASDPKGVLAVQALDSTATAQNLPALTALGTRTADQFPETNLEAEVESGQLDAGFFYAAEANSAGIPTVPLTGVNLSAAYTITVLNKAPHLAAADAFVTYLLSPAGQTQLAKYGFLTAAPPTVSGTVPAALSAVLS